MYAWGGVRACNSGLAEMLLTGKKRRARREWHEEDLDALDIGGDGGDRGADAACEPHSACTAPSCSGVRDAAALGSTFDATGRGGGCDRRCGVGETCGMSCDLSDASTCIDDSSALPGSGECITLFEAQTQSVLPDARGVCVAVAADESLSRRERRDLFRRSNANVPLLG